MTRFLPFTSPVTAASISPCNHARMLLSGNAHSYTIFTKRGQSSFFDSVPSLKLLTPPLLGKSPLARKFPLFNHLAAWKSAHSRPNFVDISHVPAPFFLRPPPLNPTFLSQCFFLSVWKTAGGVQCEKTPAELDSSEWVRCAGLSVSVSSVFCCAGRA